MALSIEHAGVLYPRVDAGDRKKIKVKTKPIKAEAAHCKYAALRLCCVTESVLKVESFVILERCVETATVCEFLKSEGNSNQLVRNFSGWMITWANGQLSVETEVQKRFQAPSLKPWTVNGELLGSPIQIGCFRSLICRCDIRFDFFEGMAGSGIEIAQCGVMILTQNLGSQGFNTKLLWLRETEVEPLDEDRLIRKDAFGHIVLMANTAPAIAERSGPTTFDDRV